MSQSADLTPSFLQYDSSSLATLSRPLHAPTHSKELRYNRRFKPRKPKDYKIPRANRIKFALCRTAPPKTFSRLPSLCFFPPDTRPLLRLPLALAPARRPRDYDGYDDFQGRIRLRQSREFPSPLFLDFASHAPAHASEVSLPRSLLARTLRSSYYPLPRRATSNEVEPGYRCLVRETISVEGCSRSSRRRGEEGRTSPRIGLSK